MRSLPVLGYRLFMLLWSLLLAVNLVGYHRGRIGPSVSGACGDRFRRCFGASPRPKSRPPPQGRRGPIATRRPCRC